MAAISTTKHLYFDPKNHEIYETSAADRVHVTVVSQQPVTDQDERTYIQILGYTAQVETIKNNENHFDKPDSVLLTTCDKVTQFLDSQLWPIIKRNKLSDSRAVGFNAHSQYRTANQLLLLDIQRNLINHFGYSLEGKGQ